MCEIDTDAKVLNIWNSLKDKRRISHLFTVRYIVFYFMLSVDVIYNTHHLNVYTKSLSQILPVHHTVKIMLCGLTLNSMGGILSSNVSS